MATYTNKYNEGSKYNIGIDTGNVINKIIHNGEAYSYTNTDRDRRGPCQNGYHVPSKEEWMDLFNMGVSLGVWSETNPDNIESMLYLPKGGYRTYQNARYYTRTLGLYWSSSYEPTHGRYANRFDFGNGSVSPNGTDNKGNARSIRPFKDIVVIPDGGTDWHALYQGAGNSGIFHSRTKKVISISADGTNWITIAEKNLGAKSIFFGGDYSEDTCGKLYIWGNNYGFPFAGTYSGSKSTTPIDLSEYGPGHYYNSSTMILNECYDSSENRNLWGGLSDKKPKLITKVIRNGIEYFPGKSKDDKDLIGIWHNPNLGLITMSPNGVDRLTMSDKNLGATEVYEQGQPTTISNTGYFYGCGSVHQFDPNDYTNYKLIDAGNVYRGSEEIKTLIANASDPWDFDYILYDADGDGFDAGVSLNNYYNLYGSTSSSTTINRTKYQGMCREGYHIMNGYDAFILYTCLTPIKNYQNILSALKMNGIGISSTKGIDNNGFSLLTNQKLFARDRQSSTESSGSLLYRFCIYGAGVTSDSYLDITYNNTRQAYAGFIREILDNPIIPRRKDGWIKQNDLGNVGYAAAVDESGSYKVSCVTSGGTVCAGFSGGDQYIYPVNSLIKSINGKKVIGKDIYGLRISTSGQKIILENYEGQEFEITMYND